MALIATPGSTMIVEFVLLQDDGLTPATDQTGGQPTMRVNGGADTTTGISVLSQVGSTNRYNATVTCPATACIVRTDYTAAGICPMPGDTIQVGDPMLGLGGGQETVNVVDGDGDPVVGCPVYVRLTGLQALAYGVTDVGAEVEFNLPAATYAVTLGPLGGYVFANPYALVASGPGAPHSTLLHCTKVTAPAAPTSPSVCRVYAYMIEEDGTAVAALAGTLAVSRVRSHPAATDAVITDGTVGSTSAAGLAYVDVVRGAVIQLTGTWATGRCMVVDNVTVPDATTLDVSALMQQVT